MTDFKGSILELKGNQAIVITDACDFVSIQRQPGMFIGQQIKFQKSDLYSTKKNYLKYLALAASVFVIVFSCVLYYPFFIPSPVFAYIAVDINPSLEFEIDKNAHVLDIKPLNKDAQTLLKDLKLVDLPVKQAIAEVVKESKQQGFIRSDRRNAVLVSASIDANKNHKPDGSEVKVLDNILSNIGSTTFDLGNEKIQPEILNVTPEYRSLAVKNKISMGRYVLYDKIKQENINITLEEAKTDRVSDMLDKAQINGSNNIKSETKNGDDTQINKTEEIKNNYGTSSDNNIDETTKSGNNNLNNGNTFEERKNVDKGKNEGIKGNNTGNSNTKNVKDKNSNTYRSTSVDQTNRADDNSNTSTSGDKNGITVPSTTADTATKPTNSSSSSTSKAKNGTTVPSTTADTATKPTNSSSSSTSKAKNGTTVPSTTVDTATKQENANPDGSSNTPGTNQ